MEFVSSTVEMIWKWNCGSSARVYDPVIIASAAVSPPLLHCVAGLLVPLGPLLEAPRLRTVVLQRVVALRVRLVLVRRAPRPPGRALAVRLPRELLHVRAKVGQRHGATNLKN